MYVCALVGVLIKWLYEMLGATIKILLTDCNVHFAGGASERI